MAVLVLLNGPPASGKSTIAQRVVDSRPLSLNLDIDVVRGMLGGWLDDPSTAGLTARSLALVMAEAHLAAGSDVIVPQFLGRTDFIERLADAADRSGARFVETALWIDRAGAIAVFADRRAAPSTQAHHDAAALVDRSEQADPVGQTRSPESSTSDLLLDESKSSPATSTRPSHALRRHSISAPRNPHCAGASTAHSEASLCQPQFLRRLRARRWGASGGAGGFVVGWLSGPGVTYPKSRPFRMLSRSRWISCRS